MNYNEAVEYLYNIPRFIEKPSLDHTRRLMNILNIDVADKKIIHVAGTNGKGSVCTYMNEILMKNGKTTGLFTSPHLVKPNERISISGKEIGDDDFLDCFSKVYKAQELLKEEGLTPSTFFEFILGMAMVAFLKNDVEYIILETGLGGRLDQTNIFVPVVSVITEIGYDHMEFLGDTLEKIAKEKAGIIKSGVPVVFAARREECTKIIEEKALKSGSPFFALRPEMIVPLKMTKKAIDFSLQYSYYKDVMISVNSVATYQMENAALALMAINMLPERMQFDGRFESVWEGRMEEILPDVYVDGGHNEDGIAAFLETAGKIPGEKQLLFSAVGDKEYPKMIENICKGDMFTRYYVTKIDNGRGISAKVLAEEFAKHTNKEIIVDDDIARVFARACKENNATLMCAGSLYLVGSLKEIVRRE